ncbi:uncharacterized protein K02A2.6-like [Bicyclus anynana]|uniref:RNA-directed DNA polymerase n=1 Tax=Bicyclus anynana TaxID=110368 RepID=A0ABM3LFK2_BICAN|nr:uncharacterized protein K02A2.6-like [Bicyclus anynana]
MPIGKIECFDLNSKKWSAYIRRVEQFIQLNKIDDDLKVATLITVVGQPTYDLMSDLCAPNNPETKTFADLVKLIGEHIEPKRSDIAERHVFRLRRQRAGEPLSQYLQALKHLASTCNFRSNLEENLRDQFVSGLASDDMRSRLFAEPELTYKRAVELAFALEAADRHAQASVSSSTAGGECAPAAEPLLRVAAEGRAARGRGGGGPGAARGWSAAVTCWRCGRRGHVRSSCGAKSARRSGTNDSEVQGRARGKIQYLDSDSASESEMFSLKVCGLGDRPYSVRIQINEMYLDFELDTGSKLSTINYDCYERYFKNCTLRENHVRLRSYTGTLIEPVGYLLVDVTLETYKASQLKLFVIKDGGPPLMGRSWLRHLKIDALEINDFLCNLRNDTIVESLRQEFPTVFAPGLGTCSVRMSLKLKDKTPVFFKARQLPLALRVPVEKELDRLVVEGTIVKVDYSDFGTPIVPVIKKSGEIRICGDYKVTINPKLLREPYPLPRIEELFAALSGGQQFSKIDLTNAYQQLLLDEDSQPYSAISTHIGTFVYKRTPYGLNCIPEKFQKFMEETLRGLNGVVVYLDDIAVTGRDRAEHVVNLKRVLGRLRDVGLRIKYEKCSFLQDSITYVGFVIDKNGLHPDPNKVKAIVDAPAPTDVPQLRSFLGLVNYYSKFLANISTVLAPLHELLKKNISWNWSRKCDKAFETIKNMIINKNILVHYDPTLPLVLSVDSSSYGIGSTLAHRYPNGEERPICFASRTLNKAERAYSQLDKEALAIVSGVSKNHHYLYGRNFIIKTDHKPLVFIFGSKSGLPQTVASRLLRYAVRLAAYDFEIEFVKSKDNCSDALSRLPLPYERREAEMEPMAYINYVEDSFPISAKEVARNTVNDCVLKNIYRYVETGWPSKVAEVEKPYFYRKDSLSIEKGCLLYNHRVVVPEVLRRRVLRELHEGHLGVVKMKSIARGYVYWPQLDAEIESLTRECSACCQQRDAPPRAQLHPWAFPANPWSRLHIDFAEFRGKRYLITVDAHSKWVEVQKMNDGTTATATIGKLRELFARFGLPSVVVSDGGPPFSSFEFAEYMRKNLITHTITSPYRPAGNGAAENAVKSVKKAMKKAVHEGMDIDTAVNKFLFQYRNAEHASTGVAPAVALLGRRLRGRLDVLKPSAADRMVTSQDKSGQQKPGLDRSVEVGSAVLARNYSPRQDKWLPADVTARETPCTYRVRTSDGREFQRHIDQLLSVRKPARYSSVPAIESSASNEFNEPEEGQPDSNVDSAPSGANVLNTSGVNVCDTAEPFPPPINVTDEPRTRPRRAGRFTGKYGKC